jgi:hypothetical protein
MSRPDAQKQLEANFIKPMVSRDAKYIEDLYYKVDAPGKRIMADQDKSSLTRVFGLDDY